jgi:hypothetical protein
VQRPGSGLIHHSDRGVQYASAEYRNAMQSAGFRASMSLTRHLGTISGTSGKGPRCGNSSPLMNHQFAAVGRCKTP